MVEVATDKLGNIVRFIITDDKFKTSKGIKVNDSREEILKNYGLVLFVRTEQGLITATTIFASWITVMIVGV